MQHSLHLQQNTVEDLVYCKQNPRNLILEGLFIQCLMLRFPPILAGRRNWMNGFHPPSKMRFLIYRLCVFGGGGMHGFGQRARASWPRGKRWRAEGKDDEEAAMPEAQKCISLI